VLVQSHHSLLDLWRSHYIKCLIVVLSTHFPALILAARDLLLVLLSLDLHAAAQFCEMMSRFIYAFFS
jgi:hypothetical protein